MTPDALLEVKDLHTYFELEEGTLKAVNGVSFTIRKNRTLGIVGESGCGKSVTAQSIMRITPKKNSSMRGQILLHHESGAVDVAQLDEDGDEMRDLRGRDIAMIFQEPMTAFSPVHTVGNQIMEALFVHGERDKRAARKRVIALLDEVGIPAPERRIDEYPFQLSGGMRQRSMIAMAIILNPRLLIADEPTTALDVTIQAQILRLMKRLQRDNGMAIMFITHDLGVIANMADDVAVMYLGKIVEYGTSRQIFNDPKHPYTKGLLRSIPKFGTTIGKHLATIKGTVPVPLDPPDACPFANRCAEFIAGACDVRMPAAVAVAPGHSVNCVLYE
ncbi:MAG: ABC transporter ATP-binding protein [Chloroflexi bacterium]|nr:ABC transporter ATP-binding protein [Chloroflexota bacterium]